MDIENLQQLLVIGRQMAETRELDPLLESAMNWVRKVCAAEFGYLILLEGDTLVFRVGQDKDGNQLDESQQQISRTIFDQVITSGKGNITADALGSFETASVLDLQLRSVICVPLISRGNVLGAIYVENRSVSNLFQPKDLELLEYFAAQAAVSIENAILNEAMEARVAARTAELAQANTRLHELATRDSLTGLFNRRHFFELAELELAKAQRYRHPITAIMLDLDKFKQINDTYGHVVGDRVLQVAGQCIQTNIREVDIAGRYGGEEFAVLLPHTTLADSREAVERLRAQLAAQAVPAGDKTIQVTASSGLVSLEDLVGISIESLLDRADQALYMAKQAGRNRGVVWQAE